MNRTLIRTAAALALAAGVLSSLAAEPAPVAAATGQALPLACGKPPTPEQRAAQQHKAPELSRQEIDDLLADPEHVVFIDLRRPDEISTCGGVPVYLNIQIGELESRLAYIPRDRKIATVSNHAARAFRAADLLLAKGYRVVGAVSAEDYAAAGGILSRPQPPAPRASAPAAAERAASLDAVVPATAAQR